jgi:hypothetical protein
MATHSPQRLGVLGDGLQERDLRKGTSGDDFASSLHAEGGAERRNERHALTDPM